MSKKSGGAKVAFVTGASAGLGEAISAEFVEHSWRVIAASRRGSSSSASALVTPIRLDVTDPEAFQLRIRETIETEGSLDALVLNAGIDTPAPIEELPLERAQAIMNTNFWGVVHGVRSVLGYFRERRNGTIVVVGSLAGLTAPPGQAIYAASKHALEGWLEGLQYEVAGFGIRVRLAQPGFLRTDLATSSAPHTGDITDYDAVRGRLHSQWSNDVDHGLDSREAAKRIVALAERHRAPFRTRIGKDAAWVPRMKALLPESWFFAGARRQYGLK